MERLLTEREVAEILGVSRAFLRQSRMKSPRISEAPSYVQVGVRAVRYRLEDLEEYVRNRRVSLCPDGDTVCAR